MERCFCFQNAPSLHVSRKLIILNVIANFSKLGICRIPFIFTMSQSRCQASAACCVRMLARHGEYLSSTFLRRYGFVEGVTNQKDSFFLPFLKRRQNFFCGGWGVFSTLGLSRRRLQLKRSHEAYLGFRVIRHPAYHPT